MAPTGERRCIAVSIQSQPPHPTISQYQTQPPVDNPFRRSGTPPNGPRSAVARSVRKNRSPMLELATLLAIVASCTTSSSTRRTILASARYVLRDQEVDYRLPLIGQRDRVESASMDTDFRSSKRNDHLIDD